MSVVEAWGARADDGVMECYYNRDHAERHNEPGTVVPLIAADRLTEEALVKAVLSQPGIIEARGEWDSSSRAVTRVLAALRAHLEESA